MRPEPKNGSEDKRTAGQIIAAAFSRPLTMPRQLRAKDPHRTPMSLRYQAALWRVLGDARREKRMTAAGGAK
jgi:hypothetical protein